MKLYALFCIMSEDLVKSLIAKVSADPGLQAKIKELKASGASATDIANALGFQLSEEDLSKGKSLVQAGELSDSDLEKVSGGGDQATFKCTNPVIDVDSTCSIFCW